MRRGLSVTIRQKIEKPFQLILLGLLRWYKLCISPMLPPSCRFYPSCSEYAVQALRKKPLLKALMMIAWRLARCNPLCKGGYDPVE